MIDTVAITLQADQFRITKPEKFKPNAKGILGILSQTVRVESHQKAICNPTKEDTAQGLYKPRMTLVSRVDSAGSYNVTLRVECSLPKLLYGNNFDELTDQDFQEVLDTLSDRMASQGVLTSFYDLKYAEVSSIHYGKNIILAEHITCGGILRELAKVNVKGWFDVAQVDYRNSGHLYKIHSNDFELAFYDKVKDLDKFKKSPKRAYEADQGIQQSLLNTQDFDTRKQVLRMEIRLGNRKKIRDVLTKIGENNGLKFVDLYTQTLAQKTLNYYWQPYQLGLPSIATASSKNPADLYQQIAIAYPKAKDGQILKLLGTYTLIEAIGWPGIRSLWRSNPRSLADLRKSIQNLNLADSIALKGFAQIEKALLEFMPLKLNLLM